MFISKHKYHEKQRYSYDHEKDLKNDAAFLIGILTKMLISEIVAQMHIHFTLVVITKCLVEKT